MNSFHQSSTILCMLLSLFLFSCEDTNVFLLADAGIDAVNAITLSDEEVKNIASQAAQESDRRYTLASPGSKYDQRLQQLVTGSENYDGQNFDFKVYLTKDVNAFAMADGTIRVYSGLMDLMNDEELLFVVGHEMGHVVKKHSRKKVVLAYASSAIRKGLASQENEVGMIARSVLGGLTERLANAQFSQHEERQADDYGAEYLEQRNLSRAAAVSALKKLDQLAQEHTFLSSHPDPAKRAERLAQGGDTGKKEKPSLFSAAMVKVMQLIRYLLQVVLSFVA